MDKHFDNNRLPSTKPYLLRAFYQWITDYECTPYIIVNTDHPKVEVPQAHVEKGRMVLNIAARAVNHLQITNEFISFDASFSGVLEELSIPIDAIVAIYAHENGRGMVFAENDLDPIPPAPNNPDRINSATNLKPIKFDKPTLKIVK